MKKILTYIVLGLMLMTVGCKQQTRQQMAIQMEARAMKNKVEKEGQVRIRKMLKGMLVHPGSYEPISTDMSIVTSNMIVYDSQAYIALRDLSLAVEDFRTEHGNDTVSESAVNDLRAMRAMVDIVCDRIRAIDKRPVEFEGIDAYHQFYVTDKHNKQIKKGYHFFFNKNNRLSMLGDQEELMRVKTFAKKLMDSPPYSYKGDSIESIIFAPIPKTWNQRQGSLQLW